MHTSLSQEESNQLEGRALLVKNLWSKVQNSTNSVTIYTYVAVLSGIEFLRCFISLLQGQLLAQTTSGWGQHVFLVIGVTSLAIWAFSYFRGR